ncbi:VOC family protein [Auraticoccus sp. F435]|uniref:VOC family protein n=1 Tax=Auraticoccus cholistanensis TaxID=2656650 RepID=A0A6A9V084_9ACTN|nr:VOC family protein [Auraticoccus cholistanensis]MVA74980.1 VOC family protein [Auraticoccus cholistanensis]
MDPAPRTLQVVVDTADALTLADWWAETLQWTVEPTDEEFVRRMVDQGYATEADTTTHHGRLVWRGAAAITPDPEAGRDRLRVLFQDVPEPKTVKNRLHLDVRTGDKDAARAELEARGARYVATHSQGPMSWHVMLDPEGNEFCVND